MAPPTFIDAEDVKRLLTMVELINAIENALRHFSMKEDGGVLQPVRTVLPVQKGFFGLMPAYSEKDDALAAKLVGFYPENKDVATHQAHILLFEPSNGVLKALIDGEVITAMRTAAASAVASKYLANPKSKVLALCGAGTQARSHYQALSVIFDFEQVMIWSRTTTSAKKLAEEIGPKAQVCMTYAEATKNADIICTMTFASKPFLKATYIKRGAHINAVGACRPDWSEIDGALMREAIVYVDSKEAALKESGDVIFSKCEVFGEVGEVVCGKKEAFPEATTVFKSLGLAIEDVVSAKLVYDKYIAERA
ncbi:unnamed protein product [Owenia fusiformis]|uniref:Ketimine reductase mu-crystallin n=1 Tax=Owenia fusiformis TaxID=6347 RepID=A0A8J1XXR3_OWEFU|nr:unnamed protein product [Owenia fusiformis]